MEALIIIILIFVLFKIRENRPKASEWTQEDERREKLIIEKIESINKSIIDETNKHFNIPSCSRCLSDTFLLIQMGSLGNSFRILCKTCGAKKWIKTKNDEGDLTFLHSWFKDLVSLENDIHYSSSIELTSNTENDAKGPDDVAGLRKTIPKNVQDRVWNRDGGKCVQCGSREKLEFDHIIPVSKGGSNTYRNIQLLCESCNRSKSNKIG